MRTAVACLAVLVATQPALAVETATTTTRPAARLREGDVIAVCGDSITSNGAYPGFIELYQLMCAPTPKVSLRNFGRWGERAHQFPPIMDKSVLPARPTVATICYGMNSCRSGRVLSEGSVTGWGRSIKAVTDKFKAHGVRLIVLASPGCVDSTHFTLAQNRPPDPKATAATQKNLSLLRDRARALAAEEGLVFADMHTPMIEVMAKAKAKYGENFAFAGGGGDGVHPGGAGHLVMTWVLLKAMGYGGDIGTVTIDLGRDRANATEGHRVLASKGGIVEIESSRYPFCFLGNPYKPTDLTSARAPRSVVGLFPFNEDLNRYRLVVRGAKARRLKVTWGGRAREFDRAALEEGVNLAAEFLDNPFCKPFARIATALTERNRCRGWLRSPRYKNDPGMAKRLGRALENMKVHPVKHTISVTAADRRPPHLSPQEK